MDSIQPMRRTYNLRSKWGWKNLGYEIGLFVWKGKYVFHRWHHSKYIAGLIWHDTTSKAG